MINYKDVLVRGIFYLKNGTADYNNWSNQMVSDFGEEIKPQLKYIRKWSLAFKDSAAVEDFKANLNCWQFIGCKFNDYAHEERSRLRSKVCPVLLMKEYDGMNNGKKAGRACWLVLNTMCWGSIQKNYIQKIQTCTNCDFYNLVIEEEELTANIYSESCKVSFLR